MVGIGKRIRIARINRGWTLAQLASETGFSQSYVSQVERGLINPSIAGLRKLAAILNLNPAELIDEPLSVSPVSVVRKGQRKRFRFPTQDIDYELLTADLRGKPFQFTWFVMPVGSDSGSAALLHDGVECGLIIQGTLEFTVDGEVHVLNAGDSIFLPSTSPHTWRNIGDVDVHAVWVGSPPSL